MKLLNNDDNYSTILIEDIIKKYKQIIDKPNLMLYFIL